MRFDCHRRRAAATGSLGQYAVVQHDRADDGRFQWTVSSWFISLKQTDAEWLVDRNIFLPLEHVVSRHGANGLRRLTVFACVGLGTAVGYGWYLQFWGWS